MLRSFVERFDPKDQKRIKAIRAALRKRFPTAVELAYDYTSHVVISYGATERGIESVVAFDARPDEMRLYFNAGPRLPDPQRLLQGTGKQTRFIPLDAASRLAHPDVEALIAAAIELAAVPLPATGKGGLVIRGAAAKRAAKATKRKSAT